MSFRNLFWLLFMSVVYSYSDFTMSLNVLTETKGGRGEPTQSWFEFNQMSGAPHKLMTCLMAVKPQHREESSHYEKT